MSRVRIRDGSGTLRTAARIRMRDAGNVLRTIQRIRKRDAAGTLRTVWQFFSVALDTNTVTGFNSGAASFGSVTSATVTGTVAGGTGPYVYAWQYVDGDATVTPTSSTAAATTFSNAHVSDGFAKEARYQLQVTDANSNVVTSDLVGIQLYWGDTR